MDNQNLLEKTQQPLQPLPDISMVLSVKDQKYLGKIMSFYLKKLKTLGKELDCVLSQFVNHCIQTNYQQSLSILVKNGFFNANVIDFTSKMEGKYLMKTIGYLLVHEPNQARLDFMFSNLSKPWKYTTAKILGLYYSKTTINLDQLVQMMTDYQYTQGILLLFSVFIKLNLINIPNTLLYQYLHLDKRIGTASVGQSIRDFTCFVFWRKIRQATPLTQEEVDLLSLHLIIVCCFDPVHHVRRAASAVFMELVGRYKVKSGILLLPHLDYFTVGQSTRAHIIGSRIALIDPYYAKGIAYYLLQVIPTTMDTDLLTNRCRVLSTILRYVKSNSQHSLHGKLPISHHTDTDPLYGFSLDCNLELNALCNYVENGFYKDFFTVQSMCYLIYALFVDHPLNNVGYDVSFGQLQEQDQKFKSTFVKEQQLPLYTIFNTIDFSNFYSLAHSAYFKLNAMLNPNDFEYILQMKCLCLLMAALVHYKPDSEFINDLLCIVFNKQIQPFSITLQSVYCYPNDLKLICLDALSQLSVFDTICTILNSTNMSIHVIIILDYFYKLVGHLTPDQVNKLVEYCEIKYATIDSCVGQIRSKILNLYQLLPLESNFLLSKCKEALVDYTNEQKGDTGSFIRQSGCHLLQKCTPTDIKLMRMCTSHVIYASYSNIDKLRDAAMDCLNKLKRFTDLLLVSPMHSIYKTSHVSGFIHCLCGTDVASKTKIINDILKYDSEEMEAFINVFMSFKRKECKINHIFEAGCILFDKNAINDPRLVSYLYSLFKKLTHSKPVICYKAIQQVIKLVNTDDIHLFLQELINLTKGSPRTRSLCIEQLYNIYCMAPELFKMDMEDILTTVDWLNEPSDVLKPYQLQLESCLQ